MMDARYPITLQWVILYLKMKWLLIILMLVMFMETSSALTMTIYGNYTSNNNTRDGYISKAGAVYSLANKQSFIRLGFDNWGTATQLNGMLSFNTEQIPNRANITQAMLSIYPYSYYNADIDENPCTAVTWNVAVRQEKKGIGSALVGDGTDYTGAQFKAVKTVNFNSVIGYINFTVNESDINRIGFTDFHLTPGWAAQAGCAKTIDFYSTEALGQSTDPYLNITYELPIPSVTLITPIHLNITTNNNQTFTCNVNQSWRTYGETYITNISFYNNHSGVWNRNQTIDLYNTYNASNASAGLVFYSKFENTTFLTEANQLPTTNTYILFEQGRVGNAFSMNDTKPKGTSALFYNVTKKVNLSLGTATFWYKPKYRFTTVGEDRHDLFYIGGKDWNNGSIYFFKASNENGFRLNIYDRNGTSTNLLTTSNTSYDVTTRIFPDTWHYLTVEWNFSIYPRYSDKNYMAVYIDGNRWYNISSWTRNWTIDTSQTGFMYLGSDGGSVNYGEILIDEFRAYNYLLNETEIKSLMYASNYTENYTAQFNMTLK